MAPYVICDWPLPRSCYDACDHKTKAMSTNTSTNSITTAASLPSLMRAWAVVSPPPSLSLGAYFPFWFIEGADHLGVSKLVDTSANTDNPRFNSKSGTLLTLSPSHMV